MRNNADQADHERFLPACLSQGTAAHQPAHAETTYTTTRQARDEAESRERTGDILLFVRYSRIESRRRSEDHADGADPPIRQLMRSGQAQSWLTRLSGRTPGR